ncbi:hypothetical protein SLA2020_358690 [Shorea laevis]
MWRSIAARSKQVVARRFCAIRNSKVSTPSQTSSDFFTATATSFYRSPRFLSNFSANPSDESHVSPLGSGDNADESESWEKGFSVGTGENGDTNFENIFGIEDGQRVEDSFGFFSVDGESQMNGTIEEDGKVDTEEQSFVGLGQDGSFGEGDEKQEIYENNEEKLENVLSLLQSRVDGSLESSLDNMNLNLQEEFVLKVLETPLVAGENLIQFFKWVAKKPGYRVSNRVLDALVLAICSDLRKRDAYALWDLVREIGVKESGTLSVESLNELICLFSKLGKGKAALEVFEKFGDFGRTPNAETYYFTIEALSKRSFFDWAKSVCEKMLHAEILPDDKQTGQIIAWLCKGDKAKDAHDVYVMAKDKNICLPQSPLKFLISSLCRKDETVKLALNMLDDFSEEEERKYAIKPFSSVIGGLCRMKDVDEAKTLLLKMIDQGPPPGNAVFNSIVQGYSKAGDMEKAKEMIKLMENRGLKPDVYTYTVVISGYANGGQMDEACKVLSEAKKKHNKLSPVTYHTLIRGYCKLEQFDEALNLFHEMKDFGVQPNVDEFNKLIQSLCLKALDWERAEKLFDEMKENRLYLNGITRALIKAVKELKAEAAEKEEARIAA